MKTFRSYERFLDDLEDYTGYQVYDQRTESTGVKTPYIVCQRISSDDFAADNRRYKKRDQVAINLHTYQPNRSTNGEKVEAEHKIEAFLEDSGVVFDREDQWIDDIELYRITYGVEIMYD